MLRASLIYLLAGFVIGACMLIHKAYPIFSGMWILLPTHIEISIFGWIIQLTMGTAYWILPRFLEGKPRGNPLVSKIMVIVFNIGILLNVATGLAWIPPSLIPLGRLLEVIAVILFISLHWSRVVSYRG
jgi:hypothetical protein